MFWGLHLSWLVENNIMSVLLMIIVSLPRPIRSNSSLTCFKIFINSKTLLSACLIEKNLVAQTNWGGEYHNY
jgi:hypothetical protein